MTDVRIFQTDNGGDVEFEGGNPLLAPGFESAAYLSLFGGNQEDDATESTDRFQWWGNTTESEPARTYRSRTQNLLLGITNVASSLLRIEEAATLDLQWFIDEGIADSVEVVASVPDFNRLDLEISIVVGDSEFTINLSVLL